MPFRKISRDIKIAAMRLYDDNILPKASILDYLGISSRTFDRVHALWVAARLAGVRFGSGSGVLGPNLNLHPGFGSGKW